MTLDHLKVTDLKSRHLPINSSCILGALNSIPMFRYLCLQAGRARNGGFFFFFFSVRFSVGNAAEVVDFHFFTSQLEPGVRKVAGADNGARTGGKNREEKSGENAFFLVGFDFLSRLG